MIEKIEIKKELSEAEFNQILKEFRESIEKEENTDSQGQFFQELVKKITPAKEVHLLMPSKTEGVLETVTLEKNITIDIYSSKGMIAKCHQTKEPLFSNDIARDTQYNKETDNFLNYPLKNLLVVPLFNEAEEILGLIWAGIPQKDWNQYMQSDIEYMMQFSVLNEKMIQAEETQEEKSQAEKLQEDVDQKGTSSMVKRLKSWISR